MTTSSTMFTLYNKSQNPMICRQTPHHEHVPSNSSSHIEPLLPIAASDLDFSFSEQPTFEDAHCRPPSRAVEILSSSHFHSDSISYSYNGSPPAKKDEYEKRELPAPPTNPPRTRSKDRERSKASRDLGKEGQLVNTQKTFEERNAKESRRSRRSGGVWSPVDQEHESFTFPSNENAGDRELREQEIGMREELTIRKEEAAKYHRELSNKNNVYQEKDKTVGSDQNTQDRSAYPTRTTSLRGYRHMPGNHRAVMTPPEQPTDQNWSSAQSSIQPQMKNAEKPGIGKLRQQEEKQQLHATSSFKTQQIQQLSSSNLATSQSPPIPLKDPRHSPFPNQRRTTSKELPQIITLPSTSYPNSNSQGARPIAAFHKSSLSALSATSSQTHGSSLSSTSIDVPLVMMTDQNIHSKTTNPTTLTPVSNTNNRTPLSEEENRESRGILLVGVRNGTFGPSKRGPSTILENPEESYERDHRRGKIERKQTPFREGIPAMATTASFKSIRPPPPRLVNRPSPMNLARTGHLRGHKHSESINSQTSTDSDITKEVAIKPDDDDDYLESNENILELELEVQRMDNGDIHLLPSPSPSLKSMMHGRRRTGSQASSQPSPMSLGPMSPYKASMRSPLLTLEVPTSPLLPTVFVSGEEEQDVTKDSFDTPVQASPQIGVNGNSPISEGAPSTGLSPGMGMDTPLTDYSGMMTPHGLSDNFLNVVGRGVSGERPISTCSNGSIFDSYYFDNSEDEGVSNKENHERVEEETRSPEVRSNSNDTLYGASAHIISERSNDWEEEWKRIQVERHWDWTDHRESQEGYRQRDDEIVLKQNATEVPARSKKNHERHKKRHHSGNKEKVENSPYVDCYSASMGVSTDQLGSWALEEELKKQIESEKEGSGDYKYLVRQEDVGLLTESEVEGKWTSVGSSVLVEPLFCHREGDTHHSHPVGKWSSFAESSLTYSPAENMKMAPSPPPTVPVASLVLPPPPGIEIAVNLPVVSQQTGAMAEREHKELDEKRVTAWPSFTIPEEQEDETHLSISPTTRTALRGQFIKGNKVHPGTRQDEHITTINTSPKLKRSPSSPISPTSPATSTGLKLVRSRSILDMFSGRSNSVRSSPSTPGDRPIFPKRADSLRIGTPTRSSENNGHVSGIVTLVPSPIQRGKITPVGIDPDSPTNCFPKKTTNLVVTPTGEEIIAPFMKSPITTRYGITENNNPALLRGSGVEGSDLGFYSPINLRLEGEIKSPVTAIRKKQSWPDFQDDSWRVDKSIQNTPVVEWSYNQNLGQETVIPHSGGTSPIPVSTQIPATTPLYRPPPTAGSETTDENATSPTAVSAESQSFAHAAQSQPGLKRFASMSLRRTLSLITRDKAGVGRSASSASATTAARRRYMKDQISDPKPFVDVGEEIAGKLQRPPITALNTSVLTDPKNSQSPISPVLAKKRKPKEKLGEITPGTLVIKPISSSSSTSDRDSFEFIAAAALGLQEEKRDIGHRMRPRRVDKEFIEKERAKAMEKCLPSLSQDGSNTEKEQDGWQCKECKRGPFPTMWICADEFFDCDGNDVAGEDFGVTMGRNFSADEDDYVRIPTPISGLSEGFTFDMGKSNAGSMPLLRKASTSNTGLRRTESVMSKFGRGRSESVSTGASGGSTMRDDAAGTGRPSKPNSGEGGRPCNYCLCRMCANEMMRDGRGELN